MCNLQQHQFLSWALGGITKNGLHFSNDLCPIFKLGFFYLNSKKASVWVISKTCFLWVTYKFGPMRFRIPESFLFPVRRETSGLVQNSWASFQSSAKIASERVRLSVYVQQCLFPRRIRLRCWKPLVIWRRLIFSFLATLFLRWAFNTASPETSDTPMFTAALASFVRFVFCCIEHCWNVLKGALAISISCASSGDLTCPIVSKGSWVLGLSISEVNSN